ncbi:GGDEF domain-containing protein, partial [Asanoa iriomotensis]
TDQQAAAATAERLRAAVATRQIEYADTYLTVTVSIGVVSYPEDGETVETLTRLADRALYAAKRSGRNQVSGPPAGP